MLLIAHRGASATCPENTLSALRAAVAAGADMCEIDVRLARDGVPVVMHDETVARTTNGRGLVAELSVTDLKRLDAGSWFDARFRDERVPTLEEALIELSGRCAVNVELKVEGAEAAVVEALKRHDALESALVSSFEWEWLGRARQLEPKLRVAPLADSAGEWLLAAARALGACAIHPHVDITGPALVQAAHAMGLRVLVWTVDEAEVMERLRRTGVDGIMTNYPARLRELIG